MSCLRGVLADAASWDCMGCSMWGAGMLGRMGVVGVGMVFVEAEAMKCVQLTWPFFRPPFVQGFSSFLGTDWFCGQNRSRGSDKSLFWSREGPHPLPLPLPRPLPRSVNEGWVSFEYCWASGKPRGGVMKE